MTLLELIVVIVILGILAAIAIPTFLAVINKSKFASAETTAHAVDSEALALGAFAQTDASGYVLSAATDLNVAGAVTAAGTSTPDKFNVVENGATVCLTTSGSAGISGSVADTTC
jgi:prepilin-type N-terminal cleavage/methylation domain-containing protein